MANKPYIAKSRALKEALKSATLLKSLNISALISGEKGVGKHKLALYTMDAPTIDGSGLDELLRAMEINHRLIIKNFDKISNFNKVKNALNLHKNKIIATCGNKINSKIEDDFFSLKIYISPLRDRLEDVEGLSQLFYEEAKEIFGNQPKELNLKEVEFDLSENCYSLKKSIFLAYLKSMLSEKDLLEILENFLYEKIGSGNDYRNLLYTFDVPLIKSGFKKFGSQLSMSKAFGLNRNTLRKKINEYEIEEGNK